MKKTTLLILLSLICSVSSMHAQTFNTQTGRENITSLDGLWRFHTGDNHAWASPNFDDSQWPLLRSDESWSRQGYPDYSGYAWYRFTVHVPDGSRPLDLLFSAISIGYQVYANGKLIGSAGAATPTHDPLISFPATFRLPRGGAGPRTIQVALRVWEYQPIASWIGGGPRGRSSAVGDPVLLHRSLQRLRDRRALQGVNEYAYSLLTALVGITILGLYLFHPDDREYLWFAVLLLSEAIATTLHVLMNLSFMPFPLWRLLGSTGAAGSLSVIAALVFFSIVLHVRRSFLWWIACGASAVASLTGILFYFQWTGIAISFVIFTCCVLPAYVWILVELALCALRKDKSARLLLAPVLLFYGFGVVELVARVWWQLGGGYRLLALVEIPLMRYPFPLQLDDVINYIFVFALLIFLVRRFSLARKEEERLAGEFEAARSVQSLLVPAASPDTPGFTVESVYIPDSEVGGDFFQVQPGEDGSVLIVVGDVSGKGLKAAMTVSTVVGALRGRKERQPAEVLAHLNRVLHGQVGGFVTCCATLITSDGAMTIANAGHLSPYRNGREMAVAGGLPLGILAEGSYEETQYQLAAGDRLTFMSDGVVEATNEKRELFGFERTQQISNQPAAAIADTAKAFGQQDDITVVTVTRAANLEVAIA